MTRLVFRHALYALVMVLVTVPGRAQGDETFNSGVFEPPRMAPAFELQGSNGSRLALSQLRGKVVVVAFGFTYCQRVCPVTLANLSVAFKKLGPAAAGVQVVFITVDPGRDNPERLREFLKFVDPSFLGATGTEAELAAIRDAYGVFANKVASDNKKLGYEVHHSSSIYLIDREGRLRALAPFGTPPDAVVHDLKLLLR